MRKIYYIFRIIHDRWINPYDEILVRFNTKAPSGDPLIWRVIVNGREFLASGFQIHGYVYDRTSQENGVQKYNLGCLGRIRWNGSTAIIFAVKSDPVHYL